MKNIEITKYKYKGRSQKFAIEYKGNRYTCYLDPFNHCSNFVVTGNGDEEGEDITNSLLGKKIKLECHKFVE